MGRWSSWRIQELASAYWLSCLWIAFWLIVGIGCGMRVAPAQPYRLPNMGGEWLADAIPLAASSALWFAVVGVGSFWIWTLPAASFAVATQGYAFGLALGTLCRFSLRPLGVLVAYALPDLLLRGMPLCMAAVIGARAAFRAWRLPFDARFGVRRPFVRTCVALYALSLVGCAYLAWVWSYAVTWM